MNYLSKLITGFNINNQSTFFRTRQAFGNLDFRVDTRYNLASVTKTITAVALLQLLEKKNLSIEDKIWPYLPTDWNINNIRNVSFRQVLMHKAGFINDPPDETYENIKRTIENGVDLAWLGKHLYKNINYGICRVLLAYLDGYTPSLQSNQGKSTSDRFIQYLQKNIFDPIAISGVSFKPGVSSSVALFYNYPFSIGGPGNDGGD